MKTPSHYSFGSIFWKLNLTHVFINSEEYSEKRDAGSLLVLNTISLWFYALGLHLQDLRHELITVASGRSQSDWVLFTSRSGQAILCEDVWVFALTRLYLAHKYHNSTIVPSSHVSWDGLEVQLRP